MIERGKVSDGFAAPLENRGQEPAKGQHQPPQKGGNHGVKEQTENYYARGVAPVPAYGRLHEFTSWTSRESAAKHQSQEVSDRVYVEGKR